MDAWALRARLESLPEKLLAHLDRTAAEARRLALRHGVDEGRAALGAVAHDVARAFAPAELLRMAEEFGLPVDEVQRYDPLLLHGPVGAVLLERDHELADREILALTAYHTTGRPEMTTVERVVFVADKIEPRKLRKRAELETVYDAAEHDLDLAILRYLELEQRRSAEKRWPLHPLEVATRNALLLRGVGGPRHAEDAGVK